MEPIAITLIVFLSITLIVGTYLLTRHRERIQMIEKGMTAEEIRSMIQFGGFKTDPLSSLKWGMVFIGVGLAVVTGIWLHNALHGRRRGDTGTDRAVRRDRTGRILLHRQTARHGSAAH